MPLTPPKKEDRFQVVLELKDGKTMPYGPTASAEFCQRVAEGINRRLVKGQRSPLEITGAGVVAVAIL